MAEPVKSRNWRGKRKETETRHSHTSEVVRERLPDDVAMLVIATAETVASHALKIAALEKDVADLKALVAGIGKVTLNDLIRSSA